MSVLKRIFGKDTGVVSVLEAGKGLIDEVFTSKEEKAEAYQKLLEITIADRDSARSMYAKDSWLQKTYAIVFLLSYVALTGYMVYMVIYMSKDGIELSQFGNTLISTIWGGMTTKVGTITDFLFGSSQGSHNKDLLTKK